MPLRMLHHESHSLQFFVILIISTSIPYRAERRMRRLSYSAGPVSNLVQHVSFRAGPENARLSFWLASKVTVHARILQKEHLGTYVELHVFRIGCAKEAAEGK